MVNQYQLNGESISEKHKFHAMNNKLTEERWNLSKKKLKNMALQGIVQQSTKKTFKNLTSRAGKFEKLTNIARKTTERSEFRNKVRANKTSKLTKKAAKKETELRVEISKRCLIDQGVG
jgi:hypothetical protein